MLLSVAVSSCSAEGHVPKSFNPTNNIWVLLQICILFFSDINNQCASTWPALQNTECRNIGSVSLDHISSTVSVTTNSLDLTSPCEAIWSPLVFIEAKRVGGGQTPSRSESGVYLYFFDVRGWDVAGFSRAATGPQPPVFVAPLQD